MTFGEAYALFEIAVGLGVIIYLARYRGGPT